MKIEELLFRAEWTSCTGSDYEENKGFKQALKFCIDKHKQGWNIEQFEQDYIDTQEQMKGMYGPYKDGMLYGLKINIEQLRRINK